MRYFFILFTILSCSSLEKNEKNFSINIKMKGSNSNEVTLERINSNYSIELIKSDVIDNDFLTIDVLVVEPSLYRLDVKGKNTIDIILEDNDIDINLDENSYTINGSKGTDYLLEIKQHIRDYKSKTYEINKDFISANQNNDIKEIISIQNKSLEMRNSYENNFKKLVWGMENSIAVFFVADYLNIENHYNFWDSLMVRYNKDLGYTSYYKELNQKLRQIKVLSIGEIAPDITLNDLNGNPLSLSSLKGKYVLLDFWAGWCRPCRVENPNIYRMYNKFNEKGFDVFQVSLDRDKSTWMNAIETDNLGQWSHVSDLKFWKSEAAIIYNIKSIPASFFLDPEGRIIAKNLKGRLLEKKLLEIFNQI